MIAGIAWRELDRVGFAEHMQACLAIYAAAMNAPRAHLPARLAIMERHVRYPRFRALAACADGPHAPIVGFAYGFQGQRGQWWHDLVSSAVAASESESLATHWLGDSFEIGEVHVHPSYQARGIGRHMLLTLTAGRTESTAVLSTRDAESPARRLYRKLGFTDLLTDFCFAGGTERYAVMGADLPLRQG